MIVSGTLLCGCNDQQDARGLVIWSEADPAVLVEAETTTSVVNRADRTWVLLPEPAMLETLSILRSVELQAAVIGAELMMRLSDESGGKRMTRLGEELTAWRYRGDRSPTRVLSAIGDLKGPDFLVPASPQSGELLQLLSKYNQVGKTLWGRELYAYAGTRDRRGRELVRFSAVCELVVCSAEDCRSSLEPLVGSGGVLSNPHRLRDSCGSFLDGVLSKVGGDSAKGRICSLWRQKCTAAAELVGSQDWLYAIRVLSLFSAVCELRANPSINWMYRPGFSGRRGRIKVVSIDSPMDWVAVSSVCRRIKDALELLHDIEVSLHDQFATRDTEVITFTLLRHYSCVQGLMEYDSMAMSNGGVVRLPEAQSKRLLDCYFPVHCRIFESASLHEGIQQADAPGFWAGASAFRVGEVKLSVEPQEKVLVCFPSALYLPIDEGQVVIRPSWGGMVEWK